MASIYFSVNIIDWECDYYGLPNQAHSRRGNRRECAAGFAVSSRRKR
jgi:hypothetical protein